MARDASAARAERFPAYADDLARVLMPADRKSVEPMAAMTAPGRTAAQHQSLLHFVGQGEWSDAAVLAKVREHVVLRIETHGAISAWIADDTGFPKKGKHSVGVARQYCGQLGKKDNCQVAVSLSIANAHASLPIAYRLYLPESWASDPQRRAKAGVPEDIESEHHGHASGADGETALAHRAGSSGIEAGDRPRSFRGPGLARVPPPCDAVHRRLRLSHFREGRFFPLGND